MKLKISNSDKRDTQAAVLEILDQIDNEPSLILVYQTYNYNPEIIIKLIREKFPKTKIAGGTTANKLLSENGVLSDDELALSFTSFYCQKDEFIGVGIDSNTNGIKCGEYAAKATAQDSLEIGILPSFIWSIPTPGNEEEILVGVQNYFGQKLPITGGSAADNDNSGNWFIYNETSTFKTGALLIAFYTCLKKTPFSLFHCAYSPVRYLGKVTSSTTRKIITIDDKCALEVYNSVTSKQLLKIEDQKSDLLSMATFPIGRIKDKVHGIPFYLLSHPHKSESDKDGIRLFTNIEDKDELFLMKGNFESLSSKIQNLLHSILFNKASKTKNISGVFIVLCATSMMLISENKALSSLNKSIKEILGEIPFLGVCSFGEQGQFNNKENLHGNFMISATLFFKDEEEI